MSEKPLILIVDDQAPGRATLEAALMPLGCRFVFSDNGLDAIKKAAKYMPDVILLDAMMPEMDGFQACRLIRSSPVISDVPIIMITALDDRDSLLRGIEAGADDFVSKPFDRVELRARIKTITRLNRYRRLMLERAKFRWVVKNADLGFVILNKQDQILYANPKARLYLGLNRDDQGNITGKFIELAKQRYRLEPQQEWGDWPKQTPNDMQFYLVQPKTENTPLAWLLVNCVEIPSGTEESFVVSIRDVTNTVVNQQEMWNFHSQVSHKLRTPVGTLTGFLRVLQDGSSGYTEEQKDKFISTAYRAANKLQSEIVDILQYVDVPDSENHGFPPCKLKDIQKAFNTVIRNLDLEKANVQYQITESQGELFLPFSQRTAEIILWEVLENSKKFHPNKTPEINVLVRGSDKGVVQLYIVDDGVNLPPEELNKAWLPYYQIEPTHSGQIPGMGLGLSMVSTSIWGVNGETTIRNREDRPGVIVELKLPLHHRTETIPE